MYLHLPLMGLLVASLLPGSLSAHEKTAATAVTPLDGTWSLAVDAQNVGRQQHWWTDPAAATAAAGAAAKPARVPWIIQGTFPGYHGVAWYWREFDAPQNPHPGGRYLLRFQQVDYLAEVWLNGAAVGGHEGGETPFVLDVTERIKPGAKNRLVVRVLNPTHQMIDGICLNQTARRCKVIPYRAGAAFNHGGITGSVELLCAPAVRVVNLFVTARPEGTTGKLHIHAGVRNATGAATEGYVEITLAPARGGETTIAVQLQRPLPIGDSLIESDLMVDHPHLWQLNDPYLYRLTVRVAIDRAGSFEERSTRCGFRDFRFAGGYFRLNGHRIYFRSTHTCNHFPIGLQFPHDPDLLRRDLLNLKVMGFNAVRFIWGAATPVQLDLCDELGLMVYEESYASAPLDPSPKMAERFDQNVSELIRRDRNHPSVVMWGLLNEASNCPAFQHAVQMLPLVRSLDDSRVVMLNSGRYDGANAGSLSNPGSAVWEDVISDRHVYPRVPHTADIVQSLRSLGGHGQPVFLSEYGIGSAVDLWRAVRHYEQANASELEDAQFMRGKLDRYLADWKQWKLQELYARPEDFFMDSLRKMAGQRTLGLNAIRSNPNIVGHSLTGAIDHVMCGEGLTTLFRELKPGTIDALFDAWAPLRWCLFAEPTHIRRGKKIHLDAVLANEDILAPGQYPARLQVVGPNLTRILDRQIKVKVLPSDARHEQPYSQTCFGEDVVVDGPSGKYRFLATFLEGGAAAGGETEFYVTDPAEMPAVECEVLLWGDDPALAKWLADHRIRTRPFGSATGSPALSRSTPAGKGAHEVILASAKPPAPGGERAFAELTRHIAAGATVVFLCPEVFAKNNQPTALLPLANKGTATSIVGWLYLKDEWAKPHPIFEGLPAGGLLDYTYYREIIPDLVWQGQDPPQEAVAGAIKASQDYASGLMVAVYRLGEGRLILNTLRIRQNLDGNPAAERLLRNMLRYAVRPL